MYVCSFMSHLLVIVMHKYKQAMFNPVWNMSTYMYPSLL